MINTCTCSLQNPRMKSLNKTLFAGFKIALRCIYCTCHTLKFNQKSELKAGYRQGVDGLEGYDRFYT